MSGQGNNSTMKIVMGLAAGLLIAGAVYMYMDAGSSVEENSSHSAAEESKNQPEKASHKDTDLNSHHKKESLSSQKNLFNQDQTKAIEEIVLSLVREKNETFMNAIQEGMQKQQEKAAEDMVKSVALIKDELSKYSLVIGSNDAVMKVYAFIDLTCPHCHALLRNISSVMTQSQDIQFNLVVAPMMGADSETLTKALYAVRLQSPEKAVTFASKLIELPRGPSKAQLILTAKEVGVDVAKFDKDRESESIKSILVNNSSIVTKLKIPGFPTLFVQNVNGEFIQLQPIPAEQFITLAVRLKAGQDLSKPQELEEVVTIPANAQAVSVEGSKEPAVEASKTEQSQEKTAEKKESMSAAEHGKETASVTPADQSPATQPSQVSTDALKETEKTSSDKKEASPPMDKSKDTSASVAAAPTTTASLKDATSHKSTGKESNSTAKSMDSSKNAQKNVVSSKASQKPAADKKNTQSA